MYAYIIIIVLLVIS